MNRLSCTGPGFDHRVAATRFAHADTVGPEHREWSLTAQLSTVPGKGGTTFGGHVVALVFGVIKEVMGFRRFHLRGLRAASGEWTLVSLAWNLKRMHALAART